MENDGFYGALIAGDVQGALALLEEPRRAQYLARLEGKDAQYEVAPPLDQVLAAYQAYWRAALYRKEPQAEEALRQRLCRIFSAEDSLEMVEETQVRPAFTAQGLQFLGGRTGGFYGPYVWKTSREEGFSVELPQGRATYTVRFLEGFVVKSWLDWLSFGAVGTGGWTDSDGVLCCVTDSYQVESESFQVSLLKHEAQHAWDLARWPEMPSEELEYRAKLVELIYSKERALLPSFAAQAGEGNGHALAAKRIVERIDPEGDVSAQALRLFWESCKELESDKREARTWSFG